MKLSWRMRAWRKARFPCGAIRLPRRKGACKCGELALRAARFALLLHQRLHLPRDQPCPSLEGHICPGPLQDYQEAVAATDQAANLHAEPGSPGQEAAEFEAAEVGHARGDAEGGPRSFVVIAEGEGGLAGDDPFDVLP